MALKQIRRKNVYGLDEEFANVYDKLNSIESKLVVGAVEPDVSAVSSGAVWYNPATANLYVYKETEPGANTYTWAPVITCSSNTVLIDGGEY